MRQFTDKEIFDEFVKRFDFAHGTVKNYYRPDFTAGWITLQNSEDIRVGSISFTFNKDGQFIDDVPDVQVDTPTESNCSVDNMDYDDLITLLGEIADKLRNM